MARATGVSRRAIRAGAKELKARGAAALAPGRIRRPGGGRKRTVDQDPTLLTDLEKLIEPTTRGDPESPLRWTCKSVRHLATALTRQGHHTSRQMVAGLLRQHGYSLQANRKTIEGSRHPDRNAQFEHIAARVQAALRQGQPAISVDTKKKELVGNFKNAGREWRPRGQPRPVRVHDFVQPGLGRAIPYGVFDLGANTGWVSVGIDHDTAAFAVASIRHWWQAMGRRAYPHARRLLITADAGGSNGARLRLWKVELQKLADRLGLPITVCHFPPGTSKWNQIEHRLFSFISKNWRGQPLLSHAVIVSLIARHDDHHGPPRAGAPGHDPLSRGPQGQSRRPEGRPSATRCVSWGLELHNPSHPIGKTIGSGPCISGRALSVSGLPRRIEPMRRSAKGFCQGLCGAVRTSSIRKPFTRCRNGAP